MREIRNDVQRDTEMLSAVGRLRDKITAIEAEKREPIAIVGIGCRLPGGVASPDELWEFLVSARSGVGEIPGTRWSDEFYDPDPEAEGRTHIRHAALIAGIREFDPYFFGISPREAATMDPQQRHFLEVAWEALEDAGQTEKEIRGSATGVFVGANATDYLQLQLTDPTVIGTYTVSGGANCMIANRLSYQFDLQGPSLVVDTACSSSLVAVHLAVQSLRGRESDMAIAGGVNLLMSPSSMVAHSKGLPLAPDGCCKTFDARADGYVRGEGVVAVVLKRLSDAISAGDRVWAVIRGSAVNQDGTTNGLTAPNGLAQRAVIERALGNARVSPADVTLLEAHGTGTALGDPIEVESLNAVYGEAAGTRGSCALGALKSSIGHLEAAAGITGLVKTALCIHNRAIVANLHLESVNPLISLDAGRLFMPTGVAAWEQPDERRNAGVSAFGAGGTNAHVILGPAPTMSPDTGPSPSGEEEPTTGMGAVARLIAISARTSDALRPMVRAYRDYLQAAAADESGFADITYSAAFRRTQHEHRAVVVADSSSQAAGRLSEWLVGDNSPAGVFSGRAGAAANKRIVFVFPGQGAQRPGMGRELMRDCAAFRDAVSECDEAMRKWLGYSVIEGVHTADDDSELGLDMIQPALFAMAVGLVARWASLGIVPDAVVGHSMGEVAAAHVAGALSLEDATRIICRRSALLTRIAGQGAMLVAALPMSEAADLTAGYRDRVSVAVSNSPTSTVLSGDPDALAELEETLRRRNVFARHVRVDVASHSPQVDSLRDDLLRELADLDPQPAIVPFYSTVTGRMCAGPELDADYWARNLRDPVLFWPTIRPLAAEAAAFIEMSPHPTLLSAVEQAFEEAGPSGLALASMRRDEPERLATVEGAAALHASGFPVRLAGVIDDGRFTRLPRYAWAHEAFWFSTRAPRAAARLKADFPETAETTAAAATGEPIEPQRDDVRDDGSGRDAVSADFVRAAVAGVLGFDPVRIDPELGFFQMGMDSILASQLRTRLEAGLGRKLPLPSIYENPTVVALTRYLQTPGPVAGIVSGPAEEHRGAADSDPELPDGLTEEDLFAILADELSNSSDPVENGQ